MIKYVLNSGGIRNGGEERAKKFFAEVVRGLGKKPKILMCFFAQPREDWEEQYPEYIGRYAALMPEGVEPTFTLALPKEFERQVAEHNVIMISGGDDALLQHWLGQFDLPKLWKSKVVATSSAGSNAVATNYWTCDWRECGDGFGFVPVRFLPHYDSPTYGVDDPRGPIDWEAAKIELEQYGDKNLPIIALEEGEFQVFEI